MVDFFRVGFFFVGFIAAIMFFLTPYLNQIAAAERKAEIAIGNQGILADVVKSEKDRARGLAGRDSIGINDGMLFVFEKEGTYGFWMKGMKFPIDIIWIRGDKIVGFVENISPEPGIKDEELKIYYPSEPINKALELRAGRIKLLKAGVGDTVKIRPLIGRSLENRK